MKKKTITLKIMNPTTAPLEYTIIKVTNSVDFMPGEIISKDEVESLCRSRHWNLTVLGTGTPT